MENIKLHQRLHQPVLQLNMFDILAFQKNKMFFFFNLITLQEHQPRLRFTIAPTESNANICTFVF